MSVNETWPKAGAAATNAPDSSQSPRIRWPAFAIKSLHIGALLVQSIARKTISSGRYPGRHFHLSRRFGRFYKIDWADWRLVARRFAWKPALGRQNQDAPVVIDAGSSV